jgi:hypothetical protein
VIGLLRRRGSIGMGIIGTRNRTLDNLLRRFIPPETLPVDARGQAACNEVERLVPSITSRGGHWSEWFGSVVQKTGEAPTEERGDM